jgi:hypothetical protein
LSQHASELMILLVQGAKGVERDHRQRVAQATAFVASGLHNHSAVILVRCYPPDISDSGGETRGAIIAMQKPVSKRPAEGGKRSDEWKQNMTRRGGVSSRKQPMLHP